MCSVSPRLQILNYEYLLENTDIRAKCIQRDPFADIFEIADHHLIVGQRRYRLCIGSQNDLGLVRVSSNTINIDDISRILTVAIRPESECLSLSSIGLAKPVSKYITRFSGLSSISSRTKSQISDILNIPPRIDHADRTNGAAAMIDTRRESAAPTKMQSAARFVGASAIFNSRRRVGAPTKVQSVARLVGASAIFNSRRRVGAPTKMQSTTRLVGALPIFDARRICYRIMSNEVNEFEPSC